MTKIREIASHGTMEAVLTTKTIVFFVVGFFYLFVCFLFCFVFAISFEWVLSFEESPKERYQPLLFEQSSVLLNHSEIKKESSI